MRSRRIALAILLCALTTAAVVRAAVGSVPTRGVRPCPERAEIRGVLDGERAALLQLDRRYRAVRAPDDAREIEREVVRLERETEIAVLRVQARHARADGHEAVAAFLEGAIRALETPPVQLPPGARPRPVLTRATSSVTVGR